MSRIVWVGLLAGLLGSSFILAQETPKIKRVPARSNSAIQGQDLFRAYCAVCHGADAKDGGPAAAALKTMPSDLTQLAARNNGRYPPLRVQRILLEEEASIVAHGSAEMPIWGPFSAR